MVQAAQRSRRLFLETVAATPAGPLHDRLRDIGARLDGGLAEGWAVAKRGHEIDAGSATSTRPRCAPGWRRCRTAPPKRRAST